MIIPFRNRSRETLFLDHAPGLFLIALLLMTLSYFLFDRPLAYLCAHLPHMLYVVAHGLTQGIDPKVHYFLWPLVFFFSSFILKKQALAQRALLFVVAIPLANLFTELLKVLFGRLRPQMLLSHELFGFTFLSFQNITHSFPSAHACTAGALVGALACAYPRYSYLFLSAGLILSFTRVILNQHFLSDILGGTLIGILTAQWAYEKMKSQKKSSKP